MNRGPLAIRLPHATFGPMDTSCDDNSYVLDLSMKGNRTADLNQVPMS